jgi:glutamate formiminotransferase/formiminotetrahydrofolate cyclodeaminase
VRGRAAQDALLRLVDEDTQAFDALMAAYRMPKTSEDQLAAREQAVEAATRGAIEAPLCVMRAAHGALSVIEAMVEIGNPNSVTDAAVGALCIQTAVMGAYLNVRTNVPGLQDRDFARAALEEGAELQEKTLTQVAAMMRMLDEKLEAA